ncbi:hypothetical protein DUNSADRAFT_14686 [Dunaliella salina]|uniref:Encoded protein n=1 Tax=Dunaliella salina TaxID=3046 RepID=A0ABQ7G6X5_DUNSA|nr:hypothetical protein DUNSADRAFT_14686 [Dunaliella salina]|eukprot:KAF5830359.1 hypothetical protein DUNSADRAFT_14686 [Dunaliella salina]
MGLPQERDTRGGERAKGRSDGKPGGMLRQEGGVCVCVCVTQLLFRVLLLPFGGVRSNPPSTPESLAPALPVAAQKLGQK